MMFLEVICSLLLLLTNGYSEIILRPTDQCNKFLQKPRLNFILKEESVTWFQAKEACEALKGVLAIPASCHDREALRALLAKPRPNATSEVTNELHAGFFRPDFFVSVFGSPHFSAGYQRWAPNQENPQVCGTFNHNLLLYDAKCMDKRSFVCDVSPRSNEEQVNITVAPLDVHGLNERNYQPTLSNITSPPWEPLMQQGRMHWYFLEHNAERWSMARRSCEQAGGHLLILDHQAEANALRAYLKGKERITELLYVGFRNGNNAFVTLFGRSVRSGWEREQPDDETCLAVTHDMLLQKVPCWWKLNFICETVLT